MVSGVVAVVKEHEVKALSRKVARVIMFGPRVRVHMLDEIKEHDRCAGAGRRQNEREEPQV